MKLDKNKYYGPIRLFVISMWLVVLVSSCSNKTLIGFYVHNKNTPYPPFGDQQDDTYLELKKDSVFIYESFYSQYHGDDVTSEYYSLLGTGKYHVIKDSLILNFISKSRTGLSNNVIIPPAFIRPPYKIEDQPITGTRVFLITNFKDSIVVGDLKKLKKINIDK